MGFEEESFERLKERAKRYIEACEEQNLEKPNETATEIAVEHFKRRLNCGGHAFEIDNCFFPNGEKLSNYVSSILDTFSFVRLLGDEPLHEDEYLVFYRFMDYEENEGRNEGHHFVKVEEDGLVTEKFGSEEFQIFQGWHDRYKNSPEVVFAVKKEHEHYFDSRFSLTELTGGLDFEQTISKAIIEKNNSFSYHSHDYRLKKAKEDEVVVIDKKGEIIAHVLTDGTDASAEVVKGKENYVENLSGPVKPIIQNGKLINIDEFKQKKTKDEMDR